MSDNLLNQMTVWYEERRSRLEAQKPKFIDTKEIDARILEIDLLLKIIRARRLPDMPTYGQGRYGQ